MTQAVVEPVGLPARAKLSVPKAQLSPQNPLNADAPNQQAMVVWSQRDTDRRGGSVERVPFHTYLYTGNGT